MEKKDKPKKVLLKKKKTVVEEVKNNLNDFTKEKLKEDHQKTTRMIDKLQNEIDNVDVLVNANKLKIEELKERIKMLDELKKQCM